MRKSGTFDSPDLPQPFLPTRKEIGLFLTPKTNGTSVSCPSLADSWLGGCVEVQASQD